MLQRLLIKNYALISEVEIDFSAGLTIITGETGAGKSIMLGALGLLLGGRADTKAVADKERKTVVEAEFLLSNGREMTLRREISPSGRSRALIDDSAVTLQELKETASGLLDIHSQHANLSLNTRAGQLHILDSMADSGEVLAEYKNVFKRYISLRKELKEKKERNAEREQRRELIEYRLEQLKKYNVKPGEQEKVESRFELLSEADEIKEHLSSIHSRLDGGEAGALTGIRDAASELEDVNLKVLDPDTPEEAGLMARLRGVYIELKDIADSIERLGMDVESNPSMLAATGARMRELIEAARAFHVESADELIPMRDELIAELLSMDSMSDELADLERETRRLAKQLKEAADALTSQRAKGAEIFSERLTQRARPLGLPNLQFEATLESGKLTAEGQDTPHFLCNFNKSGELREMGSVASGGELSRLTLSIKSLMAEKMEMPTVIFDEIDTGVSGEIADKMGNMMADMAGKMQIITITHLPQVATKGDTHYKVYKRDTEERTISDVRKLQGEERVKEIAGMISGEKLTAAAMVAARSLLGV